MTNQIEQNIINSFRLVKSDIIKTQQEVLSISGSQKDLLEKFDKMEIKIEKLSILVSELGKKTKTTIVQPRPKIITKVVQARVKKYYVAAKTGKKFHLPQCPFAQNIIPKSKVKFSNKDSALNKGYKPCKCV